jgi:hypothetical protein
MSPEPNKIPANSADARRTQRILLQVPILVRAQFAGDDPSSKKRKPWRSMPMAPSLLSP